MDKKRKVIPIFTADIVYLIAFIAIISVNLLIGYAFNKYEYSISFVMTELETKQFFLMLIIKTVSQCIISGKFLIFTISFINQRSMVVEKWKQINASTNKGDNHG